MRKVIASVHALDGVHPNRLPPWLTSWHASSGTWSPTKSVTMNPSSPSAKNNSSDANNDNYEISPTASGSPLSPTPDPQPPPTPKFLSIPLPACGGPHRAKKLL